MVNGLSLTIDGKELKALLQHRIDGHRAHARWLESAPETDEAEDAPQMPEHICKNEAKRHVWRADVLEFIHDHVEAAEVYRLGSADLEFAELLPPKPGCVEQEEYEERIAVGFNLGRIEKSLVDPGLCNRSIDAGIF